MKKLLFSLSFILPVSAQALPLFEIEQTQTKLELTGSLRVNISGSTTRTQEANGTEDRSHLSPAFTNDSSRFGFKLTQGLGDGFYSVGNVEWRFRGTSDSRHNFDDIYTRQLNIGIGHKDYGELLYGNILSILDEVRRTDLANDLTISYPLITSLQRRILQYTHTIDRLRFGVFYGGASPRNGLGLDLVGKRKNTWGGGVIYTQPFSDTQSMKISAGFLREQFHNSAQNPSIYRISTYAFGVSHTLNGTTLALDLEQRRTNHQTFAENKRIENDIRVALVQQMNDKWRVYGQYGQLRNKLQSRQQANTKEINRRFTLGTDYFIVPTYVKLFVEFRQDNRKVYQDEQFQRKIRERTTAVGMRVYW